MAQRHSRLTYEERQARRARSAVALEIAVMLARFDPIRLLGGKLNGEYMPEAEPILDRLPMCRNADETQTVVHEEFRRRFGRDVCGPRADYLGCSVAIWNWWESRATEPSRPAG